MKSSEATPNTRRILILSAGFGDGHNAAAFALAKAFELKGDFAVVADVFDQAHPTLNEFLRKGYRFAITHLPKVWSAIYRSSDAADFTQRKFDVFAPSTTKLKRTLEEFQPDAVISTYPLYAHLVERLVGSHGHLPFPFVSVVTDAQTINSIWFSSQSDHYTVIDEVSAEVLRKAGVPDPKIHVMGFPINPRFDQPDVFVPNTPLRILYLPSTNKARVTDTLRSLADHPELPARHITIVLGRHHDRLASTVATALKDATADVKYTILGWTDQIPNLLKTSHCVIGKAGGASVQEAMAAKCPLLINYVVPGQEEGNAQAALDAGTALMIDEAALTGDRVAMLLEDDRRRLKTMRSAAEKSGRPAAAAQIADFVISKIES